MKQKRKERKIDRLIKGIIKMQFLVLNTENMTYKVVLILIF